MDLKNTEMQDCHVIKTLKAEIQRLKSQHIDDIGEHQDVLHETSVAENQIKSMAYKLSSQSASTPPTGRLPKKTTEVNLVLIFSKRGD